MYERKRATPNPEVEGAQSTRPTTGTRPALSGRITTGVQLSVYSPPANAVAKAASARPNPPSSAPSTPATVRPRTEGEDASKRPTMRPSASPGAFEDLVPSCSVKVQVPLGALEKEVVSRIDGVRSVRDLAMEIGLSPNEVLFVLERLAALVPGLSLRQIEVVELGEDDLVEPHER